MNISPALITLDGDRLSSLYRAPDHTAAAKNAALVIHPDELQDGHAREAAGFAYRMLYIDSMLVRFRARRLRDHAVRRRTQSRRTPALAAVLAEAFETFPGALDPLALPAVVAGLSDALWRRCDRKIGQPRRPDDNTAVKRAGAFLDTAIESSVTAEDLDRETGIDRFSLARSFRAQMGTSPHRHLIGRRLLRAPAGIVGGLALAEAAVAAGFADQSHMTWHFKARFGVTPGRYARLLKNGRTAGRGS